MHTTRQAPRAACRSTYNLQHAAPSKQRAACLTRGAALARLHVPRAYGRVVRTRDNELPSDHDAADIPARPSRPNGVMQVAYGMLHGRLHACCRVSEAHMLRIACCMLHGVLALCAS